MAAPNRPRPQDRKSTRLNSSHPSISYAVFCLKKKIYCTNVLFPYLREVVASSIKYGSFPAFELQLIFFFERYHEHRALHSFPTRRSSDLEPVKAAQMALRRVSGQGFSAWATALLQGEWLRLIARDPKIGRAHV